MSVEKSDIERVKADMAFVRKVAAIGEHDRASKMARHLLSRISPAKFEDRKVTELAIDIRRLLIAELEEVRKGDDDNDAVLEEIYRQSQILVDDLMLCRDIHGAVGLLGQMADDGEYQRCWDSLIRITNEFSREIDSSIVKSVCTAFDWIIDICRNRGNDVEFRSQCLRFTEYLSWKFVDIDLVCKHIVDFSDWFSDDGRAQLLLDMIATLKRGRGEEIGLRFNKIEGDNFFYLGEHRKAISCYMELVLYEKWHDEHSDYLLWIAEALTALDQDDKADMFAYEVIRRLGRKSRDPRVDRAKELCSSEFDDDDDDDDGYPSGDFSPQQYRLDRVGAILRETFPIAANGGRGMLMLEKISFGREDVGNDCLIATIRLVVFGRDRENAQKKVVEEIYEQDIFLGDVPLPEAAAELGAAYIDTIKAFERTARERLDTLNLKEAKPADFCLWKYSGPKSPWVAV